MARSKIETRSYDAARYLRDAGDIVAYLRVVIDNADGDDRLILAALEEAARAQNMSQLARDAGLTRAGLYKALSGDANPSFATVAHILRALGLQLTAKPRTHQHPKPPVRTGAVPAVDRARATHSARTSRSAGP